MQPQYIRITIYDQTTKKARLLSIANNLKLSQLRELIEKQWQVRQFKFINEGTLCSKATEKHTPVAMYMKAYNLISIISQLREQPKKQSKIIQKQSKRLVQSSMAQRHIANTREFLEKERINQEREKLYEERMVIFSNMAKGNVMEGPSNKKDGESMVSEMETKNTGTSSPSQQSPVTREESSSAYHFRWTRENIEYCQLKYGIQLSETGQGLGKQYHYRLVDLDNRLIKMEDFVRRDWPNVEWLAMYASGVDDQTWRILVANAHSFPQLKILGLKHNQITTILQGDLEQFKLLKLVQFGTQDGCNPLTAQSIEVLKKFKQKNKHIKIKFRH